MTVLEIVEQWLKDNGYDGLYNDDGECACEVGELAPCCEAISQCEPGYKVPCCCCGEHDWHMVSEKGVGE